MHHHVGNAERWLTTQDFDRVIFLGDFFDDFGDGLEDAKHTALWLRNRIESAPADVFLLGNHDASYMYPQNPHLYCPGFTQEKSKVIRKILTEKHWKRFKIMFEAEGWLFSHAGFHPAFVEGIGISELAERCDEAMRNAAIGLGDPLLGAGQDRFGPQPIGGPLWLDWSSLIPISGINQVVGHTPGNRVREKSAQGSKNYCLDVRNGEVAAMLENGKITVLNKGDA